MIEGAVDAAWSPDGTQIAFLRSTGNTDKSGSRLAVTEIRSGAIRELLTVPSPRRLRGVAWSPDGLWIVVTESGQVHWMANRILLVDAVSGGIAVSDNLDCASNPPCR